MVMERLMRKFNANPVPKKKFDRSSHGAYPFSTFGIALKDVIDRDKTEIPLIVMNIFDYLINHGGLEAEGVFRVNGNSRTVETLKNVIDENGSHWYLSELSEMACDLERSVDVYSVASLLKLYLRELPDGLIPVKVTALFLEAFQQNRDDKEMCIYHLERLIGRLPVANYTLLQHLCRFLHTVWTHRKQNKMSVEALGIVFGPNVFRLDKVYEGINEQSAVNRMMSLLIENVGHLFRMAAPSCANVTYDNGTTEKLFHPLVGVANSSKSCDRKSLNSYSHSTSSTTDGLSQSPILVTDCNINCTPPHDSLTHSSLVNHRSYLSQSSDSPQTNEFSASLAAAIRVCIEEHVFRRQFCTFLDTLPRSSCMNDVKSEKPELGISIGDSLTPPVSNAPNSYDDYNRLPVSPDPNVEDGDVLYILAQRLHRLKLCVKNRERQLEDDWGRKLSQAEKRSDLQLRELFEEMAEVRSKLQQAKFSSSNHLSLKEYNRPTSAQASYDRQTCGNLLNDREAGYMSRSLVAGSDLPSSMLVTSSLRRSSPSSYTTETRIASGRPCPVSDSNWSPERNNMFGTRTIPSTAGPPPSNLHSTNGINGPDISLSETYAVLVHRLAEKRSAANRPEALHLMTPKQIEAEKLAIQKALLYFESLHGRPKSRQERLVMRPLYDRYRNVKRLLTASRRTVDIKQTGGSDGPALVDIDDEPMVQLDEKPSPQNFADLHSNGTRLQTNLNATSAKGISTLDIVSDGPADTSDQPFHEMSTPTTIPRRVGFVDSHSFASTAILSKLVSQANAPSVENSSADQLVTCSAMPHSTETRSYRWTSLPRDSGSSNIPTDQSEGEWFGSFRPTHKGGLPKEEQQYVCSNKPPLSNLPISPEMPKDLAFEESPGKLPHCPDPTLQIEIDPVNHGTVDVSIVDSQLIPTNTNKLNYQRMVRNRRTVSSPSEQVSMHTVSTKDTNLSDWSVSTLESELQTVRENKRQLQRTLKDFEHQFERATGHKVERCDRLCMRAEYNQYKILKSRLLLLERELDERMN